MFFSSQFFCFCCLSLTIHLSHNLFNLSCFLFAFLPFSLPSRFSFCLSHFLPVFCIVSSISLLLLRSVLGNKFDRVEDTLKQKVHEFASELFGIELDYTPPHFHNRPALRPLTGKQHCCNALIPSIMQKAWLPCLFVNPFWGHSSFMQKHVCHVSEKYHFL